MGMQADFKEDTVIMSEKTMTHFMYLVLEGTVALYFNYQEPDEYLFGLVGKGKTFGEISLLNHDDCLYTAVAATDVKLVAFSEHELEAFIKRYPAQALGIMKNIAKMNKVFDINLKMVMDENKYYLNQKKIYTEALKDDTATNHPKINTVKWQSTRDKNDD